MKLLFIAVFVILAFADDPVLLDLDNDGAADAIVLAPPITSTLNLPPPPAPEEPEPTPAPIYVLPAGTRLYDFDHDGVFETMVVEPYRPSVVI